MAGGQQPGGQQETPARLSDLRIRRDEQGRVVPVTVQMPTQEWPVEIAPMTYGFYRYELGEPQTLADLDLEARAKMLGHCLAGRLGEEIQREYPDGLSARDLRRDFDPWVVDDLTWCCWEYSGARQRQEATRTGKGKTDASDTSRLKRWARRLLNWSFTSTDTATRGPEASTS